MSSTASTPTFTPPPVQTVANDPGAASASSTVTISTGNSGPSTSSSLYLYTFLVTLALLLSISAAIIARSYVLRRRLRALVAAGVLPPEALINTPRRHGGTGRGGAGVDLSKKPGMYEVWPAEKDVVYGEGSSGGETYERDRAVPLSLAPISVLLAAQQSALRVVVPEIRRPPPRPARRPNFAVPFFSRRDPYAPPPPPEPRIPPTSPPTRRWNPFTSATTTAAVSESTELRDCTSTGKKEAEDMQLALLVAMPAEPGKGRGAGEVPVLEIGVRVVGVRGLSFADEAVLGDTKQTV